ncbi:hypothetical protein OSB04_026501 [Centaurea solstitialis]|uniref:Uncharacterized protein n=1 Tax=Centaurea solstitialis TaxID=347529 RepID=A0AA38SPJ8_9ASTR|nr:hypothetical protein OSB04_026501 [Centaurea solstitialis]
MESNGLQKDVEGKNSSQQHKTVEDTNNIFISKQGGWTTFPFILGSMFALTMATGGWVGNLIVYLITKYNVKSIDATQVNNIVLGCLSLFPIVGAIISDSFYGSFHVIAFFSFVSLLGGALMTLTASLPSLRPRPCTSICESPSNLQYGVLYTTLGLACIGIGGTRFTIATMGADQFQNSNDTGIYFNWYFCFFYIASAISSTALIYVQDNVSWTLGFGICVASNAVGLILFLSGKNLYRHVKPEGSPFTSITRVIVAAVRKRKVSSRNQEYNYDNKYSTTTPSDSFRFLNRGALRIESDGPKSRSWSLSTVQEVEDLKTLIRIMPLWSSSIMLSTLVGMISNFTILQALTMDRHLGGSNFKIPAASFLFFSTLATSIALLILDRLIFPTWQNLIGRSLTPLQRIGVGHVINVLALVSSALIEVQRLQAARAHHLMGSSMGGNGITIVPFSALWLVAPLAILGISEAFLFPGQISLYYQEFPTSLRSTSTAMISLLVAAGFYLSTAMTSLIRKNSSWLMDDLDEGRLDIVFWMLAAIGVVNFGSNHGSSTSAIPSLRVGSGPGNGYASLWACGLGHRLGFFMPGRVQSMWIGPVCGGLVVAQLDARIPRVRVKYVWSNVSIRRWGGNLIVYLITKYNVKSIGATQVNNVVQGCFNFFPIVAAIISDSFYGPFPLIAAFSFVSLLGVTLTTFTSAFHSLRPPPCLNPLQCDHSPSKLQYGVLYMALGLACIGFGGTRFTTTTMGADQFESPKDQENYFNITFCFFYVGYMISSTAIIYVQDNVSWTVGFGICVACNAVAVILFLFGNKFYRHIKPKGSPFTSMARVIVAAVKKRRVHSQNQQYNYDMDDISTTAPSDTFRFLNRGALKTESDGPKSRSWSLSTVQEVEDLKTLIRIMPLWSSGLLLTTLISMFGNFTILQALTMDRHLHHASHFQIPPASFLFFNTLASCISLFILDRFIFPTWQNLIGWPITPLQRIGVGHVLNFVGLVSCALIENQRMDVARAHHLTGSSVGGAAVVPFSALWLVVPLTILGIGEAFHFPG